MNGTGTLYSVGLERDFTARHFLFGRDWGNENTPHAHHYKVEIQVSGKVLDQHGYVVDIVDMESSVDKVLSLYKDKLLNGIPAFLNLNPSLEHFARKALA